jgi:hypothetical protein
VRFTRDPTPDELAKITAPDYPTFSPPFPSNGQTVWFRRPANGRKWRLGIVVSATPSSVFIRPAAGDTAGPTPQIVQIFRTGPNLLPEAPPAELWTGATLEAVQAAGSVSKAVDKLRGNK